MPTGPSTGPPPATWWSRARREPLSSKSKRLAAAALKIAGISGWDRKGGKGLVEFVVGANCGGQANKRNAYCEAFARALTASGFDGGMYYQVD